MNRLFFALSACGLLLPACAGSSEGTGSDSNALTADDYFTSNAFATLAPAVQVQVRVTLSSAPTESSRAAMVGLFRSANWIMLGAVTNTSGCYARGQDAQTSIASWLVSVARNGGTAVAVDAELIAYTGTIRATMDSVGVQGLDALLAKLHGYLGTATPAFPDPAVTCAPAPGPAPTPCNAPTTSNCPAGGNQNPTTSRSENAIHGDATSALASLFQKVEVAPSVGLLRDWSVLRARWQAATPYAQRQALRAARREGSATLARSAAASHRFDAASDLLARGGAVTIATMNTVHALAEDGGGRLRVAGEEVASGARDDHRYLPGAHVAAATTSLFGEVRARLRDGEAVPAVAALLDQRLVSIHPYANANGRITRLMTNLVLEQAGFPPAVGGETIATTLFWQGRAVDRSASLERMTAGMERAVTLVENG